MIALVIAAAATLALGLAVVRLFAGPTLYDRMLSANSTLVKAALVMAALGAATLSPSAIDAAIAILAGGVVLSMAMFKLFKAKTFQPPLAAVREEA